MNKKVRIYTIICICNTELEVEDIDTVKCPNCGKVYDDRGTLIGQE